jgi:hypothetical protein
LYQESFNSYLFIVWLMAHRSIYITMMNNNILNDLWKNLWIPEEYQNVQELIEMYQQKQSISTIDCIQFLIKFQLRCDSLDLIWKIVKTL